MKQVKIFILFFLASITLLSAETRSAEIKKTISDLEKALKAKDIEQLKACLSDDYSIGVYTRPSIATHYLQQVIKDDLVDKITFQSVDKADENGIVYANTMFYLKKGEEQEHIIAFDDKDKILFVDYFDSLLGQSRFKESKLLHTIPIYYIEGQIVIPLKLNDSDRTLNFLFDTGADGMAITKELADSLNLALTRRQQTSVVGGQFEVQISSGNNVHLSESLTLKNQNIAIFEQFRDSFDGIIGLNLVQQFITKIDFDNNQIELFSFGNHEYADKGETIKITNPETVIEIPASINIVGKKEAPGKFLLDTGANYHFIGFGQFVRKNRLLLTGFKPEGQAATVSMGVTTPVYYGVAKEFTLTPSIKIENMPVTLQASRTNDDKIRASDGSIGIQLIRNYNTTIDLLKKELHLEPVKK